MPRQIGTYKHHTRPFRQQVTKGRTAAPFGRARARWGRVRSKSHDALLKTRRPRRFGRPINVGRAAICTGVGANKSGWLICGCTPRS